MGIDFTRGAKTQFTGDSLARVLTELLDTAIVAKQKADYESGRGSGVGEVAKKRIGAGYIGEECARALAFRYHRFPKETRPSPVSPGALNRHGAAGHWTEAAMAEWLRLAGYDLRTVREDGRQFGYMVAKDEHGQARIAGEIDGVIVDGPLHPYIPMPCLWESKKATAKKFAKFQNKGVRVADPKYFGQLQTNMAYLDVEWTLFIMLNLDSMEIYPELVKFDRDEAQRLTDRAVKVLQSTSPDDLPRIAGDDTDFRCKWCDYRERCWSAPATPAAPVLAKPHWLAKPVSS